MKTNFTSKENASPMAYIAKNKQRIKQFNDTVYLKNGDEFQLELFNPTETKVLARIELNGKSIGSGIILRPGERVFLERYISEAKKFLFETYKVNGNNKEVQKAIESNGDVVVTFFKERIENVLPITYIDNILINRYDSGKYTQPITWTTSTALLNNDKSLTSNIGLTSFSNTAPVSNYASTDSLNLDMQKKTLSKSVRSKSIETGRVEKGSYSNQKLVSDSTKFEYTYSWKSEWKILPESRKEVTINDLTQYCSNCGRRRRGDKEKFCPSCGVKF